MKFIFSLLVVLLAFGCDNKSDTKPAVLNQYGMRDGSCYDYSSNMYVSNNYCNNQNGGYASNQNYNFVNGACYDRQGYQVSKENCSTYGNGYNNGYYGGGCSYGACGGGYQTSKSCYGQYIYMQGSYPQYGMCYGTNCRGYTLIEVATGQMVNCL